MTELSALKVRVDGDASGLKAAVTQAQASLSDLQKRINSSVKSNNDLEKSARKSAAAFLEFDDAKTSVDRLRASVDPLFASSKKYEAALEELNRALSLGVINQTQYNTVLKQVEAAQLGAATRSTALGGSLGRLGNVSNRTRAQIQNTSFQLQDIAVQLQGGTRASTVFAQQLPQLLGGFGALGAVLGVVAGVGIPALAFAFSAMGKAAFDLDAAMKNLETTMKDMKIPMDILQMSTDQLIEKYGQAAERVLQFALAQAQLAAAQAASRMSEQVSILDDVTGKYTSANNAGRDYANTIARIGRDFGLAKSEAQQFESMLEEVNRAGTFEEQQAALQKVLDFLKDNNVELEKIPPELQRAISEMITLSNETDRARAIMDQLAAAARGVTTGVPLFEQGHDSLLPPSPMPEDPRTGGGRRGGGADRVNPIIAELESLQQGLMTQEELQMQSYMRQQETLQSALDQRLLTQQEYNDLMQGAEANHANAMAQVKQRESAMVRSAAAGMYGDLEGLLSAFGDKSKAAAIASIALNKGLRIAEIAQNTAAAQVRALAELGPIAGPAAAAKIGMFGKIQAGVVAATGLMQAAGIKSGGATSAASAGGGAASAATAQAPAQPNVQTLNFSVVNDPFGISDRVVRQIVGAINESQRNGSNLIRATVS